jgi:hypothetical protein
MIREGNCLPGIIGSNEEIKRTGLLRLFGIVNTISSEDEQS